MPFYGVTNGMNDLDGSHVMAVTAKWLLYASVRNKTECNVQPKADGRRGFGGEPENYSAGCTLNRNNLFDHFVSPTQRNVPSKFTEFGKICNLSFEFTG